MSYLNISEYIDSILRSYSDYRLNFEDITKDQFDRVCKLIQPDQVILLRISNEKIFMLLNEFFN